MILKEPTDFRGLRFGKNPDTMRQIDRYIVSDYSYMESGQLLKLRDFTSDHLTLKPVVLYGLTTVEKDIPHFAHPLVNFNNKWIALDIRQSVSVKQADMGSSSAVGIRNDSEYQLAVQRFVLSGMWAVGKIDAVYGFTFPHLVFGDWLGSNISKKFGLTMGDQVRLTVLALIYYAHLFTDGFTDDDLMKLKLRLKAEIYTDALVDEVYKAAGTLGTLDDFCQACFAVTNNIRLKGFEFPSLVSVLSNNWFGLNASEVVMTALGHPPTWIALVYSSLTQKSFRNSYIAKTTEARNKRGAGDDFLKELTFLTSNYKVE